MVEEFYRHGQRIDAEVTVKGLPEKTDHLTIGKRELVIDSPQWEKHLSSPMSIVMASRYWSRFSIVIQRKMHLSRLLFRTVRKNVTGFVMRSAENA